LTKSFLITIGLIIVCFSEIAAQSSTLIVRDIIVAGNEKTELSVVMRESPMNVGDSVTLVQLQGKIQEFNENLIKTSLFNFVNIDYTIDSIFVDLQVKLEERWYFWIYPILEQAERNLSTFLSSPDRDKINYGIAADIYNINGRNETLKLKFRLGYKEHYLIAFHKNGFGQNRNSSVKIQTELFRQKSSEYDVLDNSPVYISDYNKYIINCFISGANYCYRPELNYFFSFGLKYKYSVFKKNIFFSNISLSGDEMKTEYLIPHISFHYDSRNSKLYPVKGLLVDVYCGENTSLREETGSFTTMGCNIQYNKQISESIFSLRSELSYYLFYDYKQKPVLLKDKLDFCRNFWIRGYELYYLVGSHIVGWQNTLGVKISDFKIHRIAKFLPSEFSKTYSRIYLDVFFDMCYVKSENNAFGQLNPMNDKLLYSTGIAINLETYYDRLFSIYVAYMGYSGKSGIFVNYKTPINKLF